MGPTRVLQVFARLDIGGAESMIMSVYKNIDREKVQFDFVVNDKGGEYAYEKEIEELGGRIFRVPQYTITNHRTYNKAWETLLKEHPEWKIIHGHHTSPAFIYLRIGKALDRITIAHSHTSSGEMSPKSKMKMITRYPLRYKADYLFACSDSAAKWMFGLRHISTHLVNNAIDTNKFVFSLNKRLEKRKDLGLDKRFLIGHIGRFVSQKNHDFLIDIFKAVYDKNDRAYLLLVGDGGLRPSIEQKVKSLGLSGNVRFAGILSDVPELLQAMDVFLFPSLYEGLSVALVEAQATGLPCIISDTITQEVDVTNLIERESLKSPASSWANRVLKYANGYERIDTSEQIKKKGYDITETANWLQKFYIKLEKGLTNE